jgi:hypothetical protein
MDSAVDSSIEINEIFQSLSAFSNINNIQKDFLHCHNILKQTLRFGSYLLPSSDETTNPKTIDQNSRYVIINHTRGKPAQYV